MTIEEFNALQDLVGPKRVKTKEVEIEAHDPLKIQQLLERQIFEEYKNKLLRGIIDEEKTV